MSLHEQPRVSTPQVVRPKWGSGAILVCAKCSKRLGDGKVVRRALKDAACRRAGAAGLPKPRLIKVGCLGLCPKRALVAASPATLLAGEVVILRDEREAVGAAAKLLPVPLVAPRVATPEHDRGAAADAVARTLLEGGSP